jgi:hypothetical protein
MSSKLLTPAEAAEYLNVSERFLANLRVKKTGPTYLKMSYNVIRYRIEDLDRWQHGCLVEPDRPA